MDTPGLPLITVAMATLNGVDRIGAAIDRVLEQADPRVEVVVVDGGSTDGTAEIVASFADRGVRAAVQVHPGLSAARNVGIAEATGDYVVFLDDDDVPGANWLRSFATAIVEHDRPALVTVGCRVVDPSGAVLDVRLPDADAPGETGIWLAGCFAARRSLLAGIGGYAEDIPTSHQTELLLRLIPAIAADRGAIVGVAEPLIDIVRRDAADRWTMSADRQLEGATYLLDHHGERYAASPGALADLLGVAGVGAARTGDLRLARHHFARAVRARPTSVRGWSRLALACIPPLAVRRWPHDLS